MKNIVFTFFLFGLFAPHIARAQRDMVFKNKQFIFKLTIDSILSADKVNYDCTVKTIDIYNLGSNTRLQTIIPGENSFFCSMDTGSPFVVQDVNFDGWDDIRLMQFMPASAQLPYYYYVYDSVKKQFIVNKSLEIITSPEFDYKNKLIKSTWKSGCCDHGMSEYQWVNGKPLLILETESAADPDHEGMYINTIKKRIDGKMKLVKKTITKE